MSERPAYLKKLFAELADESHPHNPFNEHEAFERQVHQALGELLIPVDPQLLHWHNVIVDEDVGEAENEAVGANIAAVKTPLSIKDRPHLTYDDAVSAFQCYEDANSDPEASQMLPPTRLIDEVASSTCILLDAYWPQIKDWSQLGDPASFRWSKTAIDDAVKELAHSLYKEGEPLNMTPDLASAFKVAHQMSDIIRQTREHVLEETPCKGRTK